MVSNPFNAAVITMSDSRSKSNEKLDLSGQTAIEQLKKHGYHIAEYQLISDDFDEITTTLKTLCDREVHLILTTGGTGLSPRDNTPEATLAVIEKNVPGISEAMRYHSLQITPRAMLSRGVSGICNNTLIINLPGSPKAVKEILDYILPSIYHGLEVLNQRTSNCAVT